MCHKQSNIFIKGKMSYSDITDTWMDIAMTLNADLRDGSITQKDINKLFEPTLWCTYRFYKESNNWRTIETFRTVLACLIRETSETLAKFGYTRLSARLGYLATLGRLSGSGCSLLSESAESAHRKAPQTQICAELIRLKGPTLLKLDVLWFVSGNRMDKAVRVVNNMQHHLQHGQAIDKLDDAAMEEGGWELVTVLLVLLLMPVDQTQLLQTKILPGMSASEMKALIEVVKNPVLSALLPPHLWDMFLHPSCTASDASALGKRACSMDLEQLWRSALQVHWVGGDPMWILFNEWLDWRCSNSAGVSSMQLVEQVLADTTYQTSKESSGLLRCWLLCMEVSPLMSQIELERIQVVHPNQRSDTIQHVVDLLLKLGELFQDISHEFSPSLFLAAFSLRPTVELLDKLEVLAQTCPPLSEEDAKTLKLPKWTPQELASDMYIVVSNFCWKRLSWTLCWPELRTLCLRYLEDPDGIKCPIRELKNLDRDEK